MFSILSCAPMDELNYEKIDGINVHNFPIIDGSDSTTPLRRILVAKLLDFEYEWYRTPIIDDAIRQIYIIPTKERYEEWLLLNNDKLLENNTHLSYMNLIDEKVDMILTARSISRDEKKYAESKSIIMDEKAIAKDALIFIVHPDNPVQSLTQEQIRAIYSGVITNWSEVGGFDMNITPYTRNRNSGSQEKMETIVMDGITMIEGTEMTIGQAMMSPYYQVGGDISGIGYTPFYYYDTIVQNEETKALAIDGIHPTKKTINNRSYPYTTEVYAAIRNDTDISSYTYKLFEYISTKGGQHIIEDSGYILLN